MASLSTKILFILTTMTMFITSTVLSYNKLTLVEWEVMNLMNTDISIPILIDSYSMVFMTTVMMIATSVMQFAKTYMKEEKFKDRFIILVLMFIMSMMMLILIPHTMALLLGWDGLGITSFILVIYYNNPKSLGAGMITAMTNRIGDVMLLITIALMLNQGHWIVINSWNDSLTNSAGIMILVAAMTKSAQMPFSSWLPAAMAAPTPVSALVHSSTLVTAGVFLLFRFFPLLQSWSLFCTSLAIISSMTMLMASASAMSECDMKKIIALSTLSQIAMMMFTLSLGLTKIAFFHLITHALFKALLFICAGNMIDIHHHSQDLRQMGNTVNQMPMTTTAITVANMALCGAPFTAGFYSKDLIIETFTMNMNKTNLIILTMFIAATILTTAYSTRFSLYVIISCAKSPVSQYTQESVEHAMSVSALVAMAVMGGAITNWIIMHPLTEPNFMSFFKMLAPAMMITGGMVGALASLMESRTRQTMNLMHCYMWLLSPISSHALPKAMMVLPLMELKETDQGWSTAPSLVFNQTSLLSIQIIQANSSMLMNNITTMFMLISWALMMMY